MGWLSGYDKRKSHVIKATAGAGAGYVVKVKALWNVSKKGLTHYDSDFTTETGELNDRDSNGNIFMVSNLKLWKSIDGGKTFSEIYDFGTQKSATATRGCFIDSNDKIYVSCKHSTGNNKLYRSTDGGSTFSSVHDFSTTYNYMWYMTEDASGNLYFGIYTIGDSPQASIAYLMKSTNGGDSFSQIKTWVARHIHDTWVNPYNDWLYVVVGEAGGGTGDDAKTIYRSKDGGSTWFKIVDDGLNYIPAFGFGTNADIYIGTDSYLGTNYIKRFTDDGRTTGDPITPSTVYTFSGDYSGNPVYGACKQPVNGRLVTGCSSDGGNKTCIITSKTGNSGEWSILFDGGDSYYCAESLTCHPQRGSDHKFVCGDNANSTKIGQAPPFEVSLEEHCQSDFSDVTFTDDDKITELENDLIVKEDYNFALFWVKVGDDLSSIDRTIYIYYDGPTATRTDFRENMNDYTEIDPAGSGRTTGHITWDEDGHLLDHDAWMDEVCYMYYDKGAAFYEDFEHLIETQAESYNGTYCYSYHCLGNAVGNISQGIGNYTHFRWHTSNAEGNLKVYLEGTGATADTTDVGTVSFGTTYYVRFKKIGTMVILDIYDTEKDRALEENRRDRLQITLGSDYDFRYAYACNNYDSGGSKHLPAKWNNIRQRRIVDPEPEHGDWGSEETPPLILITDSALGTENVTRPQRIVAVISDQAAGQDMFTRPERTMTVTDLTSALESILKTRGVIVTDLASALESILKARGITITDLGSALEVILKFRNVPLLDSAVGGESITRPERTITLTELASGLETISKLRNVAAILDSAVGQEAISRLQRDMIITETASGLETILKSRYLVIFDSAVGAETVIKEIVSEILKLVTDSATGSEVVSRLERSMVITDFGNGIEEILKTRGITMTDLASGLEQILKTRIVPIITDTALGSESILKERRLLILDAGSGAEQIFRPERYISISDLASGIEEILKTRNVAAIIDTATGQEVVTAVKVGVGPQTKIFLIIGDIAIQLTGS